MLDVIKQPASVAFAGSDIGFLINTDNQYLSPGTNACIELKWSDGDDPGDSFKLSWSDKEITFICDNTPDGSGTQYIDHDYGTVQEWMQLVVNYLRSNYTLSEYFEITWNASEEAIKIRALDKNADYTLTLSDISGSNVTEHSNVAGADPIPREDYRLICQVFAYNTEMGDEWEKLGEDRMVPDEDGNCLFRIQDYLWGKFRMEFKFPEENNYLIRRLNSSVKYTVRYGETYSGVVRRMFDIAEDLFAVPAGFDRAMLAWIHENDDPPMDSFSSFYTWQPNNKIISPDTPEKLYYLVGSDTVTSVKLNITVKYWDDTQETVTKFTLSNTNKGDVLEVILNYNKLQLGSLNPGKKVKYFTAWLTNQNDSLLTESRLYYMDFDYHPEETWFIFRNSYGMPETLRCIGMTERRIEVERSTAEQINKYDFTSRDPEILVSSVKESQQFKFNTGWLNKISGKPWHYSDYMREFFRSKRIYHVSGSRVYPMVILSKSNLINRDNENMLAFEFTAMRAYTDEFYNYDNNMYP